MTEVALDLREDIQPVSDFRANAATMIRQVQESGRPLVLTQRGRGAAVLLGIDSYQEMLEELGTLRDIHSAFQDIEAGRTHSHEDVRADLMARRKH